LLFAFFAKNLPHVGVSGTVGSATGDMIRLTRI
jgi:hypothetical protein